MDLNIFTKILSLFSLMLVGYIARHFKVFNDHTSKGMNKILLKITLPALIISSMIKPFDKTLFSQSLHILLISFIVYAVCFIIAILLPLIIRPKKEENGVFQFVVMFSNVGFMGFPVLYATLGKDSLFYASIYNLPFNLLTFTLGVYLLMKDHYEGFKIDIKHFINPGVVSVFIGYIIFLLSIKIPDFISEPIKLLGDTTIPLSMFLTGAMLYNGDIKKIFTNYKVYIVTILRLIIIPFGLLFILRNFITDKLFLGVIVIIGAMPAAVSTPILAEEYGGSTELAAQMVFITTLFSVITIPVITMFL